MLTECPSCLTVFRVTGAILKMGHGQVRCGKCRKQFDAIECMLEGEDEDAASSSSQPLQTSAQNEEKPDLAPTFSEPSRDAVSDFDSELAVHTASANVSEADVDDFNSAVYAEEVTMEGSRIEISGTYRMPDGTEATQDGRVREHVVIHRGDLPSISSRDPEAEHEIDDVMGEIVAQEAGETELDLNSDDGEPVAEAAGHLYDDLTHPGSNKFREAPAVPNRWRRALHLGPKKEHEEIHAELHALTRAERPRVLRTGVWVSICVLFGVILAIQVVHHNRDALVRDAKFGNTVSRLYRLFGMSPTPNWDLSAYQWDIYKVGLDPKIPDALRVVGSVANNAAFAQPYPLGKLSLKDRWESPVGVRAFEPYEYLPSPEAADRLMAPRQRTNIEIVITDPGADAVGYLIHACLEQESRIVCADDLPPRQ